MRTVSREAGGPGYGEGGGRVGGQDIRKCMEICNDHDKSQDLP